MTKLQLLQAERKKRTDENAVLLAKSDHTTEEIATIKATNAAIKALDEVIKDAIEIEQIALETAQRQLDASNVDPNDRPGSMQTRAADFRDKGPTSGTDHFLSIKIPASCKGVRPTNLMRATGGNIEDAQRAAIALCQFARATLLPDAKSEARSAAYDWCVKHGVITKAAQSESNNSLGGFLIAIELANYIISLMEEYGVARKYFRVERMSGDTKEIPRRAGAVSGYWLSDNVAITASNKVWDMITLTAKKLGALCYFSNELADDAMIDIGDDLAKEIAIRFSFMEDDAAFNGDGTVAFGGIIGLSAAFKQANGTLTTTSQGGITVGSAGSGGSWGSYTLADFNKVQATLPAYVAKRGNPRWFCSQQFYYGVMVKLAAAAGGNRIDTIENGPNRTPIFLGREVVFNEVQTLVAGNSQIDCYYGDPYLSSTIGDRKQIAIAVSEHVGFVSDQMAIRGITRLDINNHDVGGNAANTLVQNLKYDQTGTTYYGGPLVALQSYSS